MNGVPPYSLEGLTPLKLVVEAVNRHQDRLQYIWVMCIET